MMERAWRAQCDELEDRSRSRRRRTSPKASGSTCGGRRRRARAAASAIAAQHNVPGLGFLWLEAAARAAAPRSRRGIPLVEAFAAAARARRRPTCSVRRWQTVAALGFAWTLLALDADRPRPQAAARLADAAAAVGRTARQRSRDGALVRTDSSSSVIGAAAGYLALWSVYQLFKLVTGKEGMGYGDFKLLAAIGAWVGWQLLPRRDPALGGRRQHRRHRADRVRRAIEPDARFRSAPILRPRASSPYCGESASCSSTKRGFSARVLARHRAPAGRSSLRAVVTWRTTQAWARVSSSA